MKIFQELRMLLKARAWLRSTQLQAGGAVVILGAVQTWLSTKDGIDFVMLVATFVHLMPATLGGLLMALVGVVLWILRAKNEWSLSDKVNGVDKMPSSGPATPPTP